MTQEFDAIAFKIDRAAKFQQTHTPQLEIIPIHNYGEGITYHHVYVGGLEIGEYYRDPWDACSYWRSNITGDGDNCQTQKTAINNIKRAYEGWLVA